METNVESKLKSIDHMIDDLLDTRIAVEKENHKPDALCLVRNPHDGREVSAIAMGTQDTISKLISSFLIHNPEILGEVLMTILLASKSGRLNQNEL